MSSCRATNGNAFPIRHATRRALVCPDCRNVVAKQRGVTEAERARADGPRPVLVCGSRRCGAGVSKDERTWASRPGNRRNPADAWKDTRVGP